MRAPPAARHAALLAHLGAISLLAAASVAAPGRLSAQTADSITVRVRQIAGDNLYLDIGSRQGLEAGDTISVSSEGGGEPLGRVTVVGTTEERSVLAFVGNAFPIQAGDAITLSLLRPPEAAVPVEARPGPAAPPGGAQRAASAETQSQPSRPAYGRITAELSGLHSTTTVGGADPIDIGRSFATPALRFDLTVPDLFAGFELRTNVRLAYRYSEDDIVSPASSTRVYDASLSRSFTSVPLQLEIGRFRSPVENYSGYTDGLFLRFGERSFGAGVLAGFQPDRWNEAPSVERPKFSVFVDGERRGDGWWWRSDLSAHLVMGAASERDHRFLGFSQSIGVQGLLLNQDLQVDQDPESGDVSLSYLRLLGSVQVARGLRVRAGFTRHRAYYEPETLDMLGPQADRMLGGLSYGGAWGGLGLDISATRRDQGPWDTGYQGYLDLASLGVASLRARIGASYWRGEDGNTLSISPGLSRSWGDARLSVGYRFYRNDYLSRLTTQHGVDGNLSFPVSGGLRASIMLRAGLSQTLRSEQVRIMLSQSF